MAQPGDIRWNEAKAEFEVLVARRLARDEWRPLREVQPELFNQLDAVMKSGVFDEVDNDSEGGIAIFHNAQSDEWVDANEAVATLTNLSTYGERPVNWPDYEEWPPTRLQTSAEAKEAGNVDGAGKPVPARVVNTKAVTAARASETKYLTDQEKDERDFKIQQEKDARDYEAQQANIATDNQRAEQALQLKQQEFAYRQQQDALKAQAASESIAQQQATQPKRPSSLVGLMAEALDSGNTERARGLWDFENQITPLQYLQLTMEYADNPEALKVLFDFVQARRPGIIGGQGQGPVSGQPSPSQQAGFAPGSYTARSFDAQDPATQQQYLLRQQYIKAGGVPQTSSPFQNPTEALASLQARYPDAPLGPLQEEALRLTGQGQPFTQPTGALSTQPGGEVDLPDWTAPQDPRLSGDTDQDREGLTAARPAGGQPVDNSTWEGFMSGFKPFADTPGQEAAMAKNLAAGNPYAGKVMATDPATGKWTNWVDQQSGQVFMEIPGGGLSATETFNPVQKPKPPSPFNPVDLEGYLKAAQTLSASKKPKQRSPFGAPVYVARR